LFISKTFIEGLDYDILIKTISSLTASLGIITALFIPFLMRDLDKKKQKKRTEIDLKNTLIVIRNLIMYCLNYYHLKDNLNFKEEQINNLLNRFRKGSSILAHLESLRIHKEILHMINTVVVEIQEIHRIPTNFSPPKHRYEIYVDDWLLIVISKKFIVKLENYYIKTHDINLYDLLTNQKNLNIKLEDINKSFNTIKAACKTQFDFDLKFDKTIYLMICKECDYLKSEYQEYICTKNQKKISKLKSTCEDFKKN